MSSDKEKFFARTMHTPDSPERAALREAVRSVSKALLPLHRALINAAREDYAFAYEPVSPTQLIGLLGDDPFFAWLKPVTAVIVDIDELARRDFERQDVDDLLTRIDRLFGASPDPSFAQQYVPILQRDVDVAIGLAAVRQAVDKVPPKDR
jgi:hypothetical protein